MIGTIQLIFFKQFWCARYTDIQLMLGGLTLFAVAQLLVINWGPVRFTFSDRLCFNNVFNNVFE